MIYRNDQQQQLFWEFQRHIVKPWATLKCAHCALPKESETEEVHHTCQGWWQIYPKTKSTILGQGLSLSLQDTKKTMWMLQWIHPQQSDDRDPLLQTLHTVVFLTQHPTHRLNGRKSKERKQRVRVFRSQKKRSVSCEIAHHRNTSVLLLHSCKNYRSRHLNILCTSLEGSHIHGVLRVHPSSQSSLCVLSAYKTLLLWESPTCYASLLSRETIP